MTIVEAHADDCERQSVPGIWIFWLTLFVTTLMVAVTVHVLSVAFLDPSATVPKTPRAAAIAHPHTPEVHAAPRVKTDAI